MIDKDSLQGRVAIVTGCGRPLGIGAAITGALASAGCRVVVTDIATQEEGLRKLCETINTDLGAQRVFHALCDVTSQASCSAAVKRCVDEQGGLDIVVNNAGAPQGADRGDLTNVPEEAWSFILDVNLTGAYRLIRSALPHLRRSGRGRIISISSVVAIRSLSDRVAYAASKAGLLGMTVSLAGDVAGDGITVNSVCPGSVDTGRDVVRPAGVAVGPVYSWSPLGRVGEASDIAGTVLFLSSDLASYITGQAIVVDGGLSTVIKR
jgi:3-oxoacyl-[acyl-carrier protein] reductase